MPFDEGRRATNEERIKPTLALSPCLTVRRHLSELFLSQWRRVGRDHSRIRFATVERDRPEASEVLGDFQLLSLANFGDGREQADYISISTEEACLKRHDAPPTDETLPGLSLGRSKKAHNSFVQEAGAGVTMHSFTRRIYLGQKS